MELRDLPSSSAILQSVSEKNFFGQGRYSFVYKLDNDDRFVVRIPRSSIPFERIKDPDTGEWNFIFLHGLKSISDEVQIVDDPRFEGRNFGQRVATYGPLLHHRHQQQPAYNLVVGHIELLHKQKGEDLGGNLSRMNGTQDQNFTEQQIHVTANMPLSAYIGLVEDLEFLHSKGIEVDPNYDNILIEDNKKFNFVDVDGDWPEGQPFQTFPIDLFSAFCTITNYKSEQLTADRKIIVEKMVAACEKLGVPVNNTSLTQKEYSGRLLDFIGYEKDSTERLAIEKRIEATIVNSKATNLGLAITSKQKLEQ